MPLIARQRSRLAVLAVLALVGSLLAVSAVPAVAAADDTADKKATYMACVGAATEDAGFTDMGNSFAADAANCLAHYGISMGTGDGSTFTPQRAVTRLQMARFLARAAGPAGIDTMMAADQDLTDTDDSDANTVAALGIMAARSDGSFDPGGLVSRKDMAVHIAAFLSKAIVGPGGVDIDELTSDGDEGESGASPFTDIDDVSFRAHKAIRDIFELGVTGGTTATTFSPDNPVTRAQMAAFITRALDHTNARPAGITMQAKAAGVVGTDHTVSVSVRDDNHNPVPDALIDIIRSTSPDEAWDDDGMCKSAEVVGSGGTACTIDDTDFVTDPDGNSENAVVALDSDPGTNTVWAWTGELGDEFDINETDHVTAEIDAAKGATKVLVTSDMKKNATKLKFGDTVTYTLQVANEDGDPVAKADVEVTIKARIEDTTPVLDSTGAVVVGSETALRPDDRTTETKMKSDAAGRIEVSYKVDDPDASKDQSDVVALTLTLTAVDAGIPVDGEDSDTNVDGVQVQKTAEWRDTASTPTTLTLGQATRYHTADTSKGVRNTVTATLVDQYGDPVRGVKIGFWQSADTVATATVSGLPRDATTKVAVVDGTMITEKTTGRAGTVTLGYSRTGAAGTQTLRAVYVVGCNDFVTATCDDVSSSENLDLYSDNDADTTGAQGMEHYWAASLEPSAGTAAATSTGVAILVADVENNTLVLGTDAAPTVVTYDGVNDRFEVGDDPVEIDGFNKGLARDTAGNDTVDYTVNAGGEGAINSFKLNVVAN